MGSRVKVELNGNAKITNLAAFRRKKTFQKSKIWFIAIGISAVLIGAAIYSNGEDTQSGPLNQADLTMPAYTAQ